MDILLPILFLSVPIFYILGLISFIRAIFTPHNWRYENGSEIAKKRITFLTSILPELLVIAAKYPKKTVAELVKEYQEKLKELSAEEVTFPTVFSEKPHTTKKKIALEEPQQVNINWENWINNNSINLLLYLGAFLIVASASIFVGFQWQTFSGIAKASLLTTLMAAFFVLGLWFYHLPKIKNAGSTFIGIGSLLLPICGAGWYIFVLKDMGYSIGPIWLITSLIALVIYISLALFLKNAFYTYIASVSTLSFSFSLVNTYNLENDFYILSAILSSIVFLLTSITFKRFDKKQQQLLAQPFSFTANITLPAALIYGLTIAMNTNVLFTLPSVVSIFLAAGFYLMSYSLFKKIWALLAGQILVSVGIGFLCEWLHVPDHTIISVLLLFALYEIFLGYVFERYKHTEEADALSIVGIIKITLLFLLALSLEITPSYLFSYAIAGIVAGFFAFSVKRHIIYIGYSLLALTVATYILHTPVFHFIDQLYALGIIYISYGAGCYGVLLHYKNIQRYLQLFAVACGFYFILGIILTWNYPGYCLTASLIMYGVLLSVWYYFSDNKFLYFSNVLLSFSLWNLLQTFSLSYNYYPLAYTALYLCYYLISTVLLEAQQKIYRISALCGLIATPVIFGLYAIESGILTENTHSILETYALISGYIAVAVFALDSVKKKSNIMGYTASAMGMTIYFWQLYIFNIHETQIYTLPLSLYFFVLAYLQNKAKNTSTRDILSFSGIFFLLMPSLIQSFGNNGVAYALLFGGEGILLLWAGITLKYKLFIYSGIFAIVFAVISQTYQYVFSIPRWLLVGSVGLIFLIAAIYLLMKRKEE